MAASSKGPEQHLARWRLKLIEYEYEVVYKARNINANADAPSRNPFCPLRFRGKPSLKNHHPFVDPYVINFLKAAPLPLVADRRKPSPI